jgi:hypothetical protein
MQDEYDQGDLLLACDMTIPMRACRRRRDMPLIARKGVSRRRDLIDALGLDPERSIALFYMGREGIAGIRWDRIGRLGGLQLVAFNRPEGAGQAVHVLPQSLMSNADLPASVDLVVAKPGYGTCSECIAAGTPLLYLPRIQFAEAPAIDELMARWGGGLAISEDDFKSLNWSPSIERLMEMKKTMRLLSTDGGPACAAVIGEFYKKTA